MEAGVNMDVFLGKPFCILIENASSSTITLANHQRVAIADPAPLDIILSKNDEPFSYSVSHLLSDSFNVMHYKPTPDHLQEMHRNGSV